MNITINCTGQQVVYHDYFKPFICTSDIDLPQMYNQGYNSFRFFGGEPEFSGSNMPEINKVSLTNFDKYECQIQVLRKNGTKVSGYYIKYVNKKNGSVREVFNFE